MSQLRNKKISLWGQGGVALADILANSVAVILILIVVTLSVQQEKADLELEKNADITTILARQIATTVVYNDLPSSPPALLHDYNSCAIPHDCDPSLYPIVELRQNYIREYNTGLRFYRKELLKPNNPFDQLIKTFNPQEKLNIRIDVYDVSLYYLAIGILKEHDISPRHWHYLGEDVKPLISPEQALADGKHGAAGKEQEQLGEGDKFSDNDSANAQDGNEQSQQNGSSSLDNTQLADLQTLQELQHDSLLPPSENSGNSEDGKQGEQTNNSSPANQQNSQGKQGNNQRSLDSMFESLIDLLGDKNSNSQQSNSGQSNQPNGQQNQGQSGQQGRRSLKMHVPNSKDHGQPKQGSQQPPHQITLDEQDYNRVLLAFFLDQLQLARAQKTTFIKGIKEILNRYARNPEMINHHPNNKLITSLDNELKRYFINKPTQPAPITKIFTEAPNKLQLSANHVNVTSTLLINQSDSLWSENISTNNAQISLVLRSFPGLYKGQRLDFPPGHLLIVHPNETNYPAMQWRPIIIVDPWLEDASIGFVNAAFSNNKLLLDAQTLGTQVNKTLIPEPKLQENHQAKNIATILYTSIGILLFLLIIAGLSLSLMLRKKSSPKHSIENFTSQKNTS